MIFTFWSTYKKQETNWFVVCVLLFFCIQLRTYLHRSVRMKSHSSNTFVTSKRKYDTCLENEHVSRRQKACTSVQKGVVTWQLAPHLSANSCLMMSDTFPLSSWSRFVTLSTSSTSRSFCFSRLRCLLHSPSTSVSRSWNTDKCHDIIMCTMLQPLRCSSGRGGGGGGCRANPRGLTKSLQVYRLAISIDFSDLQGL